MHPEYKEMIEQFWIEEKNYKSCLSKQAAQINEL